MRLVYVLAISALDSNEGVLVVPSLPSLLTTHKKMIPPVFLSQSDHALVCL